MIGVRTEWHGGDSAPAELEPYHMVKVEWRDGQTEIDEVAWNSRHHARWNWQHNPDGPDGDDIIAYTILDEEDRT